MAERLTRIKNGWLRFWLGEEEADPNQVKTTVLIIDDEKEFLEAVSPILTEQGYGVLTSATGPKGLLMLEHFLGPVQVLLLDYKMPNFDGAATLEHVHKLRPNIKVIAVSGVEPDQLPATFRDGVDKFIRKPFKSEDLLTAIAELVSRPAKK